MHGFFFAGQEKIQIGGGSVDSSRGNDEAERKKVEQAAGLRSREITHEPERAAAKIIAGECGHQEHDDRLEERSGDDAAEKQRSAINLPVATPKDINGRDGNGCAEERADR